MQKLLHDAALQVVETLERNNTELRIGLVRDGEFSSDIKDIFSVIETYHLSTSDMSPCVMSCQMRFHDKS